MGYVEGKGKTKWIRMSHIAYRMSVDGSKEGMDKTGSKTAVNFKKEYLDSKCVWPQLNEMRSGHSFRANGQFDSFYIFNAQIHVFLN